MQQPPESSEQAIRLHCFDQQPAPTIVIEGWKQLNGFPQGAWEPFWAILAPVLMNPGHTNNRELVSVFCKNFIISPEAILPAIGCCELLLKQAATLDLPDALFQEDLENLAGKSANNLTHFIVERFPVAKKGLRQKFFEESLTSHGKVMTDLEWRIDVVKHSSKGNSMNTDVVLLTLHYQEGQNHDRITLQLTKEAAQKLRSFCDRFIDPGKASS